MLESLTLTTRRLVLRPFDKTDIETLHTLFGEEGVLRYFPSSKPPSKESVQQHVQGQQEHWRQRGYGLWAVERQKGK
jgi:ribosomal-protein-alanine N-acetyltransferase